MGLDTTGNISGEDESHQSFSVEDLVQLTAKYVVIALEFFANIDFSNLSQNDYCNICSFLRESGNKQELRDFLKGKGIETYVHSSMPGTRGYILESENNIYLESHDFLAPKKEYSSQNGYRYVRRIKENEQLIMITLLQGKYYFQRIIALQDYDNHIMLMEGLNGGNDIINSKTMEVFEFGARVEEISNIGILRIYLDSSRYIEYDGEIFSAIQEISGSYTYFGVELPKGGKSSLH